MVTVMREGQEVKFSKRAGDIVTVRDLVEWVGRDAPRPAQPKGSQGDAAAGRSGTPLGTW